MTNTHENFLQEIDSQIQAKHLLNHPFYLAWSRGELSIECLKEYAREYYHHVKAFPTYLSAIHSHTEDPKTRQALLKNLIEEEAGSPNHPELWKNFALAIGNTEEEMAAHTPNAEVRTLISTFRQICTQASIEEGIAALYAYESQIPAICVSKIEGLKKHYGMHDQNSWEYFRVHIAADEEHAADERKLLNTYVKNDNRQSIREATDAVLDGLWNMLSGFCHRHNIVCTT